MIYNSYGLEIQKYSESSTDLMWENSSIRLWLNGAFMYEALNKDDLNEILQTTLLNTSPIDVHQSPDSNESEAINSEKEEIAASLQKTRDRVFLLNAEEVEQYLPEADLRKCEITAHTTKNESNVNGWWLRFINSENNEMIQIVIK